MGLRVAAITTCVDYSEYLARSIARWVAGLELLVVVTAPRDEATIALAREHGATLHVTDAFWRDGALFRKGLALQEARSFLPPGGFHLFLDADVMPPEDWLAQLEAADLQLGMLHGARRIYEDGRPINDRELAGFFQLFHSSDPRGLAPLATNFWHAGNVDSDFMLRWPRALQRILPLQLTHLGEPGVNWCGVGNEAAIARLREARKRGRSWRDEVIGK